MKKVFSKKKLYLSFFLAGFVLLFADMVTKYWAFFGLGHMQTSLGYPYGGIGVFQNFLGIDFCVNLVVNTGGPLGVFGKYPIVLLIVRIAILLGVIIYALFLNDEKKRRIPFLLIIVGAIGNILDLFIYGYVVDMIHLVFWGLSFPVFNVADSLIFFGVTILIFQTLFKKKQAKHALRNTY